MRRLVQPAGRLLPFQLRHLGAVEREVGLPPPAGAGGAEDIRGERQQRRHGQQAEQRPEGKPAHGPLPSSIDRSRARSAAERSCCGAAVGARRRRMVTIIAMPMPSASTGVAHSR